MKREGAIAWEPASRRRGKFSDRATKRAPTFLTLDRESAVARVTSRAFHAPKKNARLSRAIRFQCRLSRSPLPALLARATRVTRATYYHTRASLSYKSHAFIFYQSDHLFAFRECVISSGKFSRIRLAGRKIERERGKFFSRVVHKNGRIA